MVDGAPAKPCSRCKEPDAPLKLRNAATCRKCYIDYVDTKVVRRLAALHKETRRSTTPQPRRYVAGLSFGPASSLLCRSLDNQAVYQRSKKSATEFEILAVHVDTDLTPGGGGGGEGTPAAAERLLRDFQARNKNIEFACVPLTRVLEVRSIDWGALPVGTDGSGEDRLRALFAALPSVTAKTDILKLLVRHLLLHVAMERGYSALLLGYSTTSLAALTLADVASGRGFTVPWHVNDGSYPVPVFHPLDPGKELSRSEFPIYHPLRELLSNEIGTYIDLVPDLKELIPAPRGASTTSVVSHRDVSIDEVMTRYFAGVEGPYAGIVTNVVKTAGKLDRAAEASSPSCGICGVTLDTQGDSTWAGELGETASETDGAGKICYGCRRSISG